MLRSLATRRQSFKRCSFRTSFIPIAFTKQRSLYNASAVVSWISTMQIKNLCEKMAQFFQEG
ncbi:MAG: hypothetical protein D3919_15005, partial [Candidatus Electrothrix sp. AW5]|nr:hypothetical protein [Candidatus Electrothrix gigas]